MTKKAAVNLTALALLLSVLSVSAKEIIIYVAPDGNDAWSGRNATGASGKTNGPLATLSGALEAARAARKGSGSDASIKILVRGGVYELAAPIVLTQEDSGGDARHPLVISAYKGEKAVFSGGRRITNWKPVAGQPNFWSAEIPEARDGKWEFRELFVNGRRMQRARTPNHGFFRIEGAGPQGKPVQFHYHAGDIKPEWAQPGDVEVIAMLAWAEYRLKIIAVDEANHIVTLSGSTQPSNQEANARYFIENSPDALDETGEWRLDRHSGVVTYIAQAGENPNDEEVIAPRLERLLEFKGDVATKRPVHDVAMEGLEFAYSEWYPPAEGHADTQAEIEINGAIRGEATIDCSLKHCHFEHLSGYALDFGRGCKRIEIVANDIADIGAGGIRLGETGSRSESFDQCADNVITDNHIHTLGRVYPAAIGVLVLRSGGNTIAHNEINDLFYTAISVGWLWGYEESPCHDNRIEFNHLHHIGQDMLSDMGAIYTLGIQPGTVIRNNLIHDVSSFTYGGWGIYPDEGTSYVLIENNIVYRTKSAGFHQHYGKENMVHNNIFAFAVEHQIMRTRAESHISFTFTNNIIYFDTGDALGSNWSGDQFAMDKNIYFDARPGASAEAKLFAGKSFAEWQREGHDRNSIIADPKFIAPDKYDFRLRSDSPAVKLGFEPIDMSTVGVREKVWKQ